MESLTSCITEATTVEKNKQRWVNHKYHLCLSTDIKRLKVKGIDQRQTDKIYLHLKHCLFSRKPPTLEKENQFARNSQKEIYEYDQTHLDLPIVQSPELLSQSNEEIYFDQNISISSNDNDELGTYESILLNTCRLFCLIRIEKCLASLWEYLWLI